MKYLFYILFLLISNSSGRILYIVNTKQKKYFKPITFDILNVSKFSDWLFILEFDLISIEFIVIFSVWSLEQNSVISLSLINWLCDSFLILSVQLFSEILQ